MKRMMNLGELKDKESKYILVLSSRGKLELNVAIYVQEEVKTFLVKIDQNTLEQLATSSLDFSTLDYVDVTKQIKQQSKNKNSQQLMFVLEDVS
jgi:hypothetical protein